MSTHCILTLEKGLFNKKQLSLAFLHRENSLIWSHSLTEEAYESILLISTSNHFYRLKSYSQEPFLLD